MLKKRHFLVLVLCLLISWVDGSSMDHIRSGQNAFNGASELGPFFEKLKQDFQITTAIETGTFYGSTTAFFGLHFKQVHTIDIEQHYYNQAQKNLSNFSNVHFHLGSSEKVLAQILPGMRDRFILFYLDAHWNEFWPLRDELEEIGKTHHNNCIIVIDDIKVPGRSDIAYDAYGSHECSYDYVKDKVEKLFDRHTIHYLIPDNVAARAKLVIIPN